jgi:hypothetical protein
MRPPARISIPSHQGKGLMDVSSIFLPAQRARPGVPAISMQHPLTLIGRVDEPAELVQPCERRLNPAAQHCYMIA